MSRCASCDEVVLSPRELSRKSAVTGEPYDLCDYCFSFIADTVMAVTNELAEEIIDERTEDVGEIK